MRHRRKRSIFDRLRGARDEISAIESDLDQATSDEEKEEIDKRIRAIESIANSKNPDKEHR